MTKSSTIELFKEYMKFSAGHFTIFTQDKRENLHGHNYSVYASFKTFIADEGLSFDYRYFKTKLKTICDSIDEVTLLPTQSKYLKITDHDEYYHAQFHHETMIFLKRDVVLLPVTNITVEELSGWFLNQLLLDKNALIQNNIQKIKIKIFSSPGQSGSATWKCAHA